MPFNGFDIDFKSLRAHRGTEGLTFTFTLQRQVTPLMDVATLREIVDGFNNHCASLTPPIPVVGSGWIQLPTGAFAGVLWNTQNWDDVLQWLEVFTQGLGHGGAIRGGPAEHGPRDPRNVLRRTEPTVFCSYATSGEPDYLRWGVTHELGSRLSDQMADWVTMPRAKNFLTYETTTPVAETHLGLPLLEALERDTSSSVTATVELPERDLRRTARAMRGGLVSYFWWDEDLDWKRKRADLEQALLFSPADLRCGFVTRSYTGGWRSTFSPPWPHTTPSKLRYDIGSLRNRVPDACGMQVLTDGHLAQAHDLETWLIKKLAGGRCLVTHPNVDDWYADDVPPAELLESARNDFGSMILSQKT